jgi:hypothetical protein
VRYPTRKNGLIIPPYELNFTVPTEEQLNTRRRATIHHGYYNRSNYSGERIHNIFRNLVTNVYPLLAEEHTELHNDFSPPIKPRETLMIDVVEEYLAVNGTVDCIRESKTRQVYQLTANEWERVRNGVQQVHASRNSLSPI